MRVDYNELMKLNQEFETLYSHLKDAHNEFLKIINDAECLDDEKIDIFHSYTKDYEAKIATLKSDFYSLESDNKKIESCLSQTRLLKKKRVTKLESNIAKNMKEEEDFDLPF